MYARLGTNTDAKFLKDTDGKQGVGHVPTMHVVNCGGVAVCVVCASVSVAKKGESERIARPFPAAQDLSERRA